MNLSIWQLIELTIIFGIAYWCVREPESVGFLIGKATRADRETITFEDAETIRVLRMHTVQARKDGYQGRHRAPGRTIGQAEYRRQLARIGQDEPQDEPDWLKPLYTPWRPDW